MDDLNFKIYFKVLMKNGKIIIFFTLLTLLLSSVYNVGIKKPPVPQYQATGSIDVTGAVLLDKSIPSIIMDDAAIQKFYDQAAVDSKVNKTDYKMRLDTSTTNIVKISGSSLKSEGLALFVNSALHHFADEYTNKNKKDTSKSITLLSNEDKEKVIDAEGNLSLVLAQNTLKEITDANAKEKTNIETYKSLLESNNYNILSNNFLVEKLRKRESVSTGIVKELLIKMIIDTETNLDRYSFITDYNNFNISKSKEALKKYSQLLPLYTMLYNSVYDNEVLNSKTIVTEAVTNQVVTRDTRVRSIIISSILAMILICLFSLAKEYFIPDNSSRNEDTAK